MATHINELAPAFAIPPGEMLLDELNQRNLTLIEFAQLTGIEQGVLSEIVAGKKTINSNTATAIGKVLKMDAALWLNMQSNYEADLAKVSQKHKVEL